MAYTTRKSLLEAIRTGDDISWQEFHDIYRPLICRRGLDYHLTKEECDELVQTVLLDLFQDTKTFRYDSSKGKFRTYLGLIISHNIIDIRRKRHQERQFQELEDNYPENNPELEERWNTEWHEHVMGQALQDLREQIEAPTFQAFELYAIKGEKAEKVARFLDTSVNSVYVAKNRAVSKLREIVQKYEI